MPLTMLKSKGTLLQRKTSKRTRKEFENGVKLKEQVINAFAEKGRTGRKQPSSNRKVPTGSGNLK